MQPSATALHWRIQALLTEDQVLARQDPHLTLTWSDTWHRTDAGLLGTVTVDVIGVDDRTRAAVLERVALIIQAAPANDATIREVRAKGDSTCRSAPNQFTVLTSRVIDDPPPFDTIIARVHAEQVRDYIFFALAEDDRLAMLGYRYETIRGHHVSESPPGPDVDILILTWADLNLGPDGGARQRLQMSIAGPSARSSAALLRTALDRARAVIMTSAANRPPIKSVTSSSPYFRRCLGHELLTIGFDITTS